ncbi:rho guanine nucleotide exchange factor 37 [Brachyhypopomus gauderio]|uniref:rho guanine nucleotide exchange factor 37 n=1 Tax=Brachyhypopomus gauderio TaxID=698409 RepID=UPI004043111B
MDRDNGPSAGSLRRQRMPEAFEEERASRPVWGEKEDVEEPVEDVPEEEEDEAEVKRAEGATDQEKAAHKQFMAIQELVDTERNYLRNLQICTGIIRANLQQLQPPLVNLDSMFLHVDKVMDVSARFLSLLDQAQIGPGNPQYLELLCGSFLSVSQDIETAYKEYLAHYNNVTVIENGYKQKEAQWMEMVKVIKSSAPEVNASTLTFFLVMPVQRIARYPLLLQMVQKHTDARHQAAGPLEHSVHTAIQINCTINEYKRFREVADKYKKTENLTIIDKINRLSGHSIAKKTARLSQYIKHETGMVPKLVDEEFDALAGFFFVLEKGIMELHDNMEAYLSHLRRFLSCRPEEADLDLEGEKAALFSKEISVAVRQWIYPAYESRLKALVFKPLCVLRELTAGPRNLIRKRQDKLLDFERLEEKGELTFEERAASSAYTTIHALLLAELPRFNSEALQLLWAVLGSISVLQRDLAADMEQLAGSFTHQLPHSHLDSRAFWEWAEGAARQGAAELQALCENVRDELSAPIVQALGAEAEKRLKVLVDKHGQEKIYQLTGPVVATRDLDLNLNRGELVAVLTEMDTRGDRRRWLVDAGGPRGYVPAAKLTRYHQVSVGTLPTTNLSITPSGPGRRHSYSPGPQHLTTAAPTCVQVFAGYDFTARSGHELSLRAGEPVRVVEAHDKRGNGAWSLVEARGHRGYVPSNYLTMLPTVTLSPTLPYR